MADDGLKYCGALAEHYYRAWGTRGVELRHTKSPEHRARQVHPDLRVAEFPPKEPRTYWVYATLGMALRGEAKLELHLLSPIQDMGLVELLWIVAWYHQSQALLGLHHTVNFGRPWLAGSAAEYGFVSLPYLCAPSLEVFEIGDQHAHCYWLIPITEAERDYKKQHGAEALEQAFEKARFDYLDPHRASVV